MYEFQVRLVKIQQLLCWSTLEPAGKRPGWSAVGNSGEGRVQLNSLLDTLAKGLGMSELFQPSI